MKRVVAVTAFALLFLWFSVFTAWTVVGAYPRERFSSVNDRPVLESATAIEEAVASGRCAFRIGGEHYVVENLPKEYLEYSERLCRMP